jgi:hypothetical protein
MCRTYVSEVGTASVARVNSYILKVDAAGRSETSVYFLSDYIVSRTGRQPSLPIYIISSPYICR